MALAWARIVAQRCSGCGTLPDEWPEQPSDLPEPYEVQARRCYGCEMLAKERENVPAEEKGIYLDLVTPTGDEEPES